MGLIEGVFFFQLSLNPSLERGGSKRPLDTYQGSSDSAYRQEKHCVMEGKKMPWDKQTTVSRTILVGLALAGGLWMGDAEAFGQFGVPISDPAPLNTDAPTESRNDIEPHITTDGLGNWLAVWAGNELPGNEYDIFVAHSMDSGATWTAPAPLNTNGGRRGQLGSRVAVQQFLRRNHRV